MKRLIQICTSLWLIIVVSCIQAQNVDHRSVKCPDGYFLYIDKLCYPKVKKPCPFETQTTAPTTTTSTAASPKATASYIVKRLECPEGSVMMENKCRKIICSLGEFYRGSCLQPVCPQGLVWRGKQCQEPGYLTTIIEIDNVIVSETKEQAIALSSSRLNEVVYHTLDTTTTSTTAKPLTTTQSLPLSVNISNPSRFEQQNAICCKVFTPRICKLYGSKWLCFNRKYQRCDSRICLGNIVYLKAPEIKYESQLLVMPPEPQLSPPCVTVNCRNDSGTADCSGCVNGQSENCSAHCYRYICPSDICKFLDLKEYCKYYPGQDGCLPKDGCLWKWC